MSTTLEFASETIRESSVVHRFNLAPGTKKFRCKFIEPGLVSYRDVPGGGLELLRKETIDAALESALDNPLTIGHVQVTLENRLDVENGVVTGVDYNSEDGWYYANGTADTDQAISKIQQGQRPSCAYAVRAFGPGGVYHGIKYDREIMDIEFQHLAIVEKPRYEGADFRLNSLTNPMKLFKFIKNLLVRENGIESSKTEVSEMSGNTVVEIDGVPVRLNDLAAVWEAQKGQIFQGSMDDMIEIDGQCVKMNELVATYKKNRCNEGMAGHEKKETPAQEKAEHKKENAAPAAAVKENAAPAAVAPVEVVKENAAAPAPVEVVKENAAPAPAVEEGLKHFQTLHNARENAASLMVEEPSLGAGSLPDRVKNGQNKYGSAPVIVAAK
jgi:hypothetical protein